MPYIYILHIESAFKVLLITLRYKSSISCSYNETQHQSFPSYTCVYTCLYTTLAVRMCTIGIQRYTYCCTVLYTCNFTPPTLSFKRMSERNSGLIDREKFTVKL